MGFVERLIQSGQCRELADAISRERIDIFQSSDRSPAPVQLAMEQASLVVLVTILKSAKYFARPENTGNCLCILKDVQHIRESRPAWRQEDVDNIVHLILRDAVMSDNLLLVKELVKHQNISISYLGPMRSDESPFDLAVDFGKSEMVRALLASQYSLHQDEHDVILAALNRAKKQRRPNQVLLRILNSAAMFKKILNSQDSRVLSVCQDKDNFDLGVVDRNGDNLLTFAVYTQNQIALKYFLERDDIDILAPYQAARSLVDYAHMDLIWKPSSDSERTFELLVEEVVGYLHTAEESYESESRPESIEKFKVYCQVLARLYHPIAQRIKGRVVGELRNQALRDLYIKQGNIDIFTLSKGYCRDQLYEMHEEFYKAVNAGRDGYKIYEDKVKDGSINVNLLYEGNTLLTIATQRKDDELIDFLMQSPTVLPHRLNEDGTTAPFMAFKENNVKAFAAMLMKANIELPLTKKFGGYKKMAISFPGVRLDVDINPQYIDQLEMWQSVSLFHYYQKDDHYRSDDESQLAFVSLLPVIREQVMQLRSSYAAASQLSVVQAVSEFNEQDAYFVTRHKSVRFLDDPTKRGQYDVQSAVMMLRGVPISPFSIRFANPVGPSIAYHGDMTRVKAAAKGDMVMFKLYKKDARRTRDGQEVEYERTHGWQRLSQWPLIPGQATVKIHNREGGAWKVRTGKGLSGKLRQIHKRVDQRYYVSKKGASGKGRIKVNEAARYFQINRVLPYNEIAITTAAAQPRKDEKPGDDMSHIVISAHQSGGVSICSLVVAVSLQVELLLHEDTKLLLPICYYDAPAGRHMPLSSSSLAFMTKLYELVDVLPFGAINFNMMLSDILPDSMTLPQFFTSEAVSTDLVMKLLTLVVRQEVHGHDGFMQACRAGRYYDVSLDKLVFKPYVGAVINNELLLGFSQLLTRRDDMMHAAIDAFLAESSRLGGFSPLASKKEAEVYRSKLQRVLYHDQPFLCATLSHEGYRIVRHLPDMSPWKSYWDPGVATELPMSLMWQQLAMTLINMPYEERYNDKMGNRRGRLIFRLNHDVTHAVRKAVGIEFLFKLIEKYGYDFVELPDHKIQLLDVGYSQCVLTHLTAEERALVVLVGFLERCGRTNELSGQDDPSNALRSMEVIKSIAHSLGFNSELVKSICTNAVNFTGEPIQGRGFQRIHGWDFNEYGSSRDRKAKVMSSVLTLSHQMDLGRCRPGGVQFVADYLSNKHGDMIRLFPHDSHGQVVALIKKAIGIMSDKTGVVSYDMLSGRMDDSTRFLAADSIYDTVCATLADVLDATRLSPSEEPVAKRVNRHYAP